MSTRFSSRFHHTQPSFPLLGNTVSGRHLLGVFVAFAGWPIEIVAIEDLHLDLTNVRIRDITVDETAALNYLYADHEVMNLATDILRDGYIDNEFPIVVMEDGHWIVLEGNRRVSALKGLNNPEAVPSRVASLRRLIARFGEDAVPAEIRVMAAPDRQTAQPVLARLHTKNPKKSWPREQQATFYHSQLSDGTTPDDLRRMYPGASGSISRFLRMGEMNELIRGLKYPDKKSRDFVLQGKLKMTAFEYAYGKPKIQAAAGLEFSNDGLLANRKLSTAHSHVLVHILGQFQAGTLNTRSPELRVTTPEHEEFVARLNAIADGASTGYSQSSADQPRQGRPEGPSPSPNRPADDSSSADLFGGKGLANETPLDEGTGESRGPNRGHTKKKLNMQGVVYSGSSAGLRRRLEELRKLDVKDYPNAAYDLLRTVLECSIKQYFRDIGDPVLPATMLNGCMTKAANHFASDKYLVAIINAINSGGKLSSERFYLSSSALNSTNHEPDVFVEGEHVHHAWDHMAPLIKRLLSAQPAT